MMPQYLPLDRFRRAEVLTENDRMAVYLKGQRRSQQLATGIQDVRAPVYSTGIEYIIRTVLDFLKACRDQGASNNAEWSARWDDWLADLEVTAPEVDNVLTSLAHPVAIDVIGSVESAAWENTFSGPWFAYDPPDFNRIGIRISESLAEIARSQIANPGWERQAWLLLETLCTFGYAVALAEHEKRIQPRLQGSDYADAVVDRGTTLRTILPKWLFYGKRNEADWQEQPFIGYADETTMPLLESNHIAAILGEDGLVYPEGAYFNLAALWNKVQKSTGDAEWDAFAATQNQSQSFEVISKIRRLLRYTFWTQDLDIGRVVGEGINRGTDWDEVYLELGITPQDVESCRWWKVAAIATGGGTASIAQPDTLIQILPNPYAHQKAPFIGGQAIDFFGRAAGLGYGQLTHDLNLAANLLFTLIVDNSIKANANVFVMMKDALALDQESGFVWRNGAVYELDPQARVDDVRKILQRLSHDNPNWMQALQMLDRIYGIGRRTSGTERPPYGGRKTALEVSAGLNESTSSIRAKTGRNFLSILHQFAELQVANNGQLLDHQDAIRLAGQAGQDLDFVSWTQEQLNGPIFAVPMRVRILGKDRIGDRFMRTKLLVELFNSRPGAVLLQHMAQNLPLPRGLRMLSAEFMRAAGIEELDRWFIEENRQTTEQVVELLQNGTWVEVDMSRFRTPDDAIRELQAVAPLVRAGSPLAEEYYRQLWDAFEEWLAQIQVAQAAGSPPQGQIGGGQGIAQEAGVLPNVMTMPQAQLAMNVPTYPA